MKSLQIGKYLHQVISARPFAKDLSQVYGRQIRHFADIRENAEHMRDVQHSYDWAAAAYNQTASSLDPETLNAVIARNEKMTGKEPQSIPPGELKDRGKLLKFISDVRGEEKAVHASLKEIATADVIHLGSITSSTIRALAIEHSVAKNLVGSQSSILVYHPKAPLSKRDTGTCKWHMNPKEVLEEIQDLARVIINARFFDEKRRLREHEDIQAIPVLTLTTNSYGYKLAWMLGEAITNYLTSKYRVAEDKVNEYLSRINCISCATIPNFEAEVGPNMETLIFSSAGDALARRSKDYIIKVLHNPEVFKNNYTVFKNDKATLVVINPKLVPITYKIGSKTVFNENGHDAMPLVESLKEALGNEMHQKLLDGLKGVVDGKTKPSEMAEELFSNDIKQYSDCKPEDTPLDYPLDSKGAQEYRSTLASIRYKIIQEKRKNGQDLHKPQGSYSPTINGLTKADDLSNNGFAEKIINEKGNGRTR